MENVPYIIDKEAGLETIRDPMVALIDGKYYLTGTQPPYWTGENAGVHLWFSEDLKHWTDLGVVIKRDDMPASMWCRDRFWAPEIFDGGDGYYYITFNCRNDDPAFQHRHSSGIARAERPEGPYTIMTVEKPLPDVDDICNDAHLFRDGKDIYFFCNHTGTIYLYRLDTKTFKLTDPKCVMEVGKEGEWDHVGIEGPCCVKRHGLYFLWYSSWTYNYDAGIAVSDSLYGTWKKCGANPILHDCDIWRQAGHNHAFRDKDGKDYITFHAFHKAPGETLERFFIHQVEYHPDGTVTIFGLD